MNPRNSRKSGRRGKARAVSSLPAGWKEACLPSSPESGSAGPERSLALHLLREGGEEKVRERCLLTSPMCKIQNPGSFFSGFILHVTVPLRMCQRAGRTHVGDFGTALPWLSAPCKCLLWDRSLSSTLLVNGELGHGAGTFY